MKIQAITANDIAEIDAMRPKDWGSLVAHLQYYINMPNCFPLKLVEDNKIIGIGNTILHKNTAWLSHIIVHEEYRGKGLGTTITQALINSVPTTHKTILLIATELGEYVYKKLGFETETEYIAFKDVKIDVPSSPLIQPFEEKYRGDLHSIDTNISGESRFETLNPHLAHAQIFVQNNQIEGFYAPTFGDGLIMANTPDAGIELMKYRLKSNGLCLFPVENSAATSFLVANNYSPVKQMKKMRLGEKIKWEPQNIYNRAGGNFG
jgi:GNAT superfamily N-acetyltransferase